MKHVIPNELNKNTLAMESEHGVEYLKTYLNHYSQPKKVYQNNVW